MKNLSVALKAHYALGSTTLATCWKATLRNNTVVAATSHDRDIEFPIGSGVTYLSVAAYTPTDIDNADDLSPDNLELEGFLRSPAITDTDIYSGLWDYAAIEMFEVNFNDLTMGRNLVRSGTLGQVRAGKAKFAAELRGLMQAYSRRIVRLATKECTADLGDARCTIDLAPHTLAVTVEAVADNRVIQSTRVITILNWYTGGLVTFTSGANSASGEAGVNLSMEVKQSNGADITLQEQMPFPIAVDDAFTISAGCMKRFMEDCIGKFNNGINFRGFPHLPGTGVFGISPATRIISLAPAPFPPGPAPAPSPAGSPPPPPPPPAPAPGPAPAPPASSVFAVYFESYYQDDITTVPTTFNTVNLFHCFPDGDPVSGSWTNVGNGAQRFADYATVTPERVQTVRARGQRVILTMGGAGAGYVYDTRTKSNNAIASLQDIIAALGGLDGVDFNNYEAQIMVNEEAAFTTEMSYIAGRLKSIYGSNFVISTPAGVYPEDKRFIASLVGAGLMDYAAPQFYDWSGFNVPGYISTQIGQLCALIGASHVCIGFGASYANGPSLADCEREWLASKAANPSLRGMFGWSFRTNRAAGNVWSNTMSALL